MGAERFGWHRRAPQLRRNRDGEWRIGMGCATGPFPMCACPARRPGSRSTATDRRRVAARRTKWAWARRPCSASTPRTGSACRWNASPSGSAIPACRSAALPAVRRRPPRSARPIIAASGKLAGELLRLAGNDTPLAGLRAGEVEFADGGLRKIDEPSRYESFASILQARGTQRAQRHRRERRAARNAEILDAQHGRRSSANSASARSPAKSASIACSARSIAAASSIPRPRRASFAAA